MLDFKFITAHFINNEKTTVESQWEDSDKNVHIDVTEVEEGNLAWEEILKHTTLEDIHENTASNIKGQQKDFRELVMKIAKEDGLTAAPDNTKKWPKLVKTLFSDRENDEDLFALKLALFELDSIRGSANTGLKTQLRKSKTRGDVLKFAFEISAEIPVVKEST